MKIGPAKFWRNVVRAYVRRSPLQRGKRRVMELFAPLYAGSEPQRCQLPGGARINADLDEHVQRWIYFFGVYEEATVRWFCSTLKPGMTVLDIGAHVGQYSLIAASYVGAQGRVHSFEPNPASFLRLNANLALNDFSNVTTHPLAVSDSPGEATLYVPQHDNLGEASLQPCMPGMVEQKVRCVTIDEWAKTAALGESARIDVIKIDVQGLEGRVLRGAQETLRRYRPLVVCEFEERWLRGGGTSSVELKAMLSEMGYCVNRIAPAGLVPVDNGQVHSFENLILVPSGTTRERTTSPS